MSPEPGPRRAKHGCPTPDPHSYRYAVIPYADAQAEMKLLQKAGSDGIKVAGCWKHIRRDGQWVDVEIPGFDAARRATQRRSLVIVRTTH